MSATVGRTQTSMIAATIAKAVTDRLDAIQSILAEQLRLSESSVQNLSGAGALALGLGNTQPQPGTGIVLGPGQAWDGRVSGAVWKGSVSVVGIAAGVLYSWLDA